MRGVLCIKLLPFMKKLLLSLLSVGVAGLASHAQVVFQNHSKTPPSLVKVNTVDFPAVQAFGLISSWDTLALTPSYRFAGSADGAGILKNADGTFTYLVNQEDNFSVSRIQLDASFTPVSADYLLNSNGGMWRLCSATMATPEIHGFGPVFLTCGESSVESMTHALNPYGLPVTDSTVSALTTLTGFGRWSAENAVPLPKNTFHNKTVVMIGDDDSGPNGGQLAMYVSSTGDLNNGKIYVMRRKDLNQSENQILVGNTYNVEFIEIPNHKTLTGDQLNKIADTTAKSIKFGRVEDIDYRKGNADAAREIYFNSTGSNYTGIDSVNKTIWGKVFRLKLDANNMLNGTLECILNGDDKSASNPGAPIYQPDNICVTEDYVYVQEDPNSYTMPWALPYVHDARIYQYDIETKAFRTLLEVDHHRSAPDSLTYNRNSAGTAYSRSTIGSWEYGALVDVSAETGVPNAFVLSLQPHSFRYPFFAGVDGGTLRASENQGSMLLTLTNIPRVKAKAPVVNGITICSGATATLNASGGSTFAADNGTTYRWYATANAVTPVYTGSSFTTPALTAATTYHVATFVSGNESATRTPVTVNITNNPIVNLGNDLAACENTTLDAGNTGASYTWSNGAATKTINVVQSGMYKVTVTQNGCAASDSINVTINAKPAAPTINIRYNNVLVSNHSTGNKWYKDGVEVSTDSSYTVTGNGVYTLTYTDPSTNCTSDAASLTFSAVGIAEAFEMNGFKLYPNPNSGTFTLEHNQDNTRSLTIQVVSFTGQLVYLEEVKNYTGRYDNIIDLSKEAAGTYIVNIVTDKTVVQKKIIKQ